MNAEKAKPHQLWLFTNRTWMVFDQDGQQIAEDQNAVGCHELDKVWALQVTLEAQEFRLACWGKWEHTVTRKEMQYLLGLRTLQMDLEDIDRSVDECINGST